MKNPIIPLFFLFFALFAVRQAHGDGFIVLDPPRPDRIPLPLAVKHHHVEVEIQDRAALTKVDQVFFNPNPVDLEGTYLFPLPEGAAIASMSLWIDGREHQAELLPRDEAVRIYTDIVRRMKDPALLEYFGDRFFRVRIFPIEAGREKRVQIAYTEELALDSGLLAFRYPLSTEKFSSSPLESVSIDLRVESAIPIKSLFSPSHDVDVALESEHRGRVTYEKKGTIPRKDFLLYAALADTPIGAALAANRTEGKEGYFSLYLAPGIEAGKGEDLPKDIVFVFDTSGSMQEPGDKSRKIDQARGALRYCVQSLDPADRFNIVAFSTVARPFRSSLQHPENAVLASALEFVQSMEARGGTNIDEALRTALSMRQKEESRPFYVVFLTDGQPTLGDRQTVEALTALVREEGSPDTRVFVFGVGFDVNTLLLDRIASESRGDRVYISPDEDIELKVGGFFEKIAAPVLTDLRIEIDGVACHDLYPPHLPDLFRGSCLTLHGRYGGSGHAAVKVSGKLLGKTVTSVHEVVFPARCDAHPQVPRLWAASKIGFLLDQLRLKRIDVAAGVLPDGPDRELVDEIAALSTEFGIVTPYTAFLVVEDTRRRGRAEAPAARRIEELGHDAGAADQLGEAEEGMVRVTGKAAFKASRDARALQQGASAPADQDDAFTRALNRAGTFREILDKTFVLVDGTWYDTAYREGAEKIPLAFLSDAYFDLIGRSPRLARYLSVGSRVTVCFENRVYEIRPE